MQLKQPKGFFITGTDTHVGKTTITKMLLSGLIKDGHTAIACKPVACHDPNEAEGNDALHFLELNSLALSLNEINPIRFNMPISPNIAARALGKEVTVQSLTTKLQRLAQLPVDYILFEGAGGWKVPLNDQETLADLAITLGLPVILVVGIRLGCLNHALLTIAALEHDQVPVAGWIANTIDNQTAVFDEQVATLRNRIAAPFLGTVPYLTDDNEDCFIDLEQLKRCYALPLLPALSCHSCESRNPT